MVDQLQSTHQKHCIETIFFVHQMSEESYLIFNESKEIVHNLTTLIKSPYFFNIGHTIPCLILRERRIVGRNLILACFWKNTS